MNGLDVRASGASRRAEIKRIRARALENARSENTDPSSLEIASLNSRHKRASSAAISSTAATCGGSVYRSCGGGCGQQEPDFSLALCLLSYNLNAGETQNAPD